MKKAAKRFALMLSVLLCATPLVACSQAPGEAKIQLTDSAGRTVSMNKPAEKIVALFPSDVEILYALGAQDQLIAVGEYCNYPPETAQKTTVGTGSNTSTEQLIALKPDLVIMGLMSQQADQADQLAQAGIAVYLSEAQSIEDAYVIMEHLGALSGKSAEAEALVGQVKDGLAAVSRLAKENPVEKKVYVEVSPLAYGLFTCGGGTFIDELVAIAGGTNAFGDQQGWVQLSEEQVIAINPDVILTTSNEETGLGDPIEEICARPGWDTVSAVTEGWVATIDPDECTRPGPRLVRAAEAFYQAIRY